MSFTAWATPRRKPFGATTVSIHLNVEDIDAVFARAVRQASPQMPPADMFRGDRFGKLIDPFGHAWSLSTHLEDLSLEEVMHLAETAMCQTAAKPHAAASS